MRLTTLASTLAVTAVLSAAGGAVLGNRYGTAETLMSLVGEQDVASRRGAALRHALDLERSYALYGQDLWLLQSRFPGVRDGWFVDVGSADGVAISNTKRLEEAGWSGLCIDPFPRNMSGRTCQVVAQPVDAEAGRLARFFDPGRNAGGLVSYAGWWVPDEAKARAVEVTTTTLAEVLDRAGAPAFIHYMNVDIEGAEHAALSAFPFDRYRIGALTVEHNNVEERRARIRELLERNGYRLEWAIRDQDWYVPREDPPASTE
jgi:hypothetical protein